MNAQKAYNVLLHADRFSGPMIGITGRMPETVEALLSLVQAPQASEAFKALLEEATLPGQLYALCGIYFTDRKAFKQAVERYRYRDDSVETQFGCKVGFNRVSDLVETSSPLGTDILGGGYPAQFRRAAIMLKPDKQE
jgi:hypothetical protein